jgi:hypothetical protein
MNVGSLRGGRGNFWVPETKVDTPGAPPTQKAYRVPCPPILPPPLT